MTDASQNESQPPEWVVQFKQQISPSNWCIPVESIWRKYGWVPPSKECPETIAKHATFRTWHLTQPARESQ